MTRLQRLLDRDSRTFAALLDRDNGVLLLRLCLASAVVVSHSFPLGGFAGGIDPTTHLLLGQDRLGLLAVEGFFVLSGFLVTASADRLDSTVRFLWHRFLRLAPGLWVCLVVTAFGLAPLAWHHEHHTMRGFLGTDESPIRYVWANLAVNVQQWSIAGLLGDVPFQSPGLPGAPWNGSLWSLAPEVACYLAVAIALFAGLHRHRQIISAITLALYIAAIGFHVAPARFGSAVPWLAQENYARVIFMFALGSTMYSFAGRIRFDYRLALVAAGICAFTASHGGWVAAGLPAFAYLVVWLAIAVPFPAMARWGDWSYGVYIYAFPIQMLLAEFSIQAYGLFPYLFLSLVLALLAGFLSWHLVEKRCLAWKSVEILTREREPRMDGGRARE